MIFLLIMDVHVNDGGDVDVDIAVDDVEVGILLVPLSWPGIDSWLSIMALWLV